MISIINILAAFNGLARGNIPENDDKLKVINLWSYEILRVFSDRLNTDADVDLFVDYLKSTAERYFFETIEPEKIIFGDFDGKNILIERTEQLDFMKQNLADYNQEKSEHINLFLFTHNVEHVSHLLFINLLSFFVDSLELLN